MRAMEAARALARQAQVTGQVAGRGLQPLLDYEVTTLLMVATSGLVIPFDRLKSKGDANGPMFSPAFDGLAVREEEQFKAAAAALKKLQEVKFTESSLYAGNSWRHGRVETPDAPAATWVDRFSEANLERLTAYQVLGRCRNALAHGNIGIDPEGPWIIFASIRRADPKDMTSPAVGFDFVAASPADFRGFLDAWFAFLEGLSLRRSLGTFISVDPLSLFVS